MTPQRGLDHSENFLFDGKRRQVFGMSEGVH